VILERCYYSPAAMKLFNATLSVYDSNRHATGLEQAPSPDDNIVEVKFLSEGGSVLLQDDGITSTRYTLVSALKYWILKKASANKRLLVTKEVHPRSALANVTNVYLSQS
jgi:hypothetical protein